jgi:hypothetical protein
MPDVFYEGRHTAEFMVSEANGNRSREVGVLAAGEAVKAGTVLGQSDATSKYSPLNPASTAGFENATALLYDNVPASEDDRRVVLIKRDAEVKPSLLVWPDDINEADKATAMQSLDAVGIAFRSS